MEGHSNRSKQVKGVRMDEKGNKKTSVNYTKALAK